MDPSREELSVAEGCWCITVDCSGFSPKTMPTKRKSKKSSSSGILTILGIRTLESFSSPTIPTPSSITGSGGGFAEQESVVGGRGGINISMLKKAVKVVGAVAPEVWEALEGIVERERNSKRE